MQSPSTQKIHVKSAGLVSPDEYRDRHFSVPITDSFMHIRIQRAMKDILVKSSS